MIDGDMFIVLTTNTIHNNQYILEIKGICNKQAEGDGLIQNMFYRQDRFRKHGVLK